MIWDGYTAPDLAYNGRFYPTTGPNGELWSIGGVYPRPPPCMEVPCPYTHGEYYADWYGGKDNNGNPLTPLGTLSEIGRHTIVADTEDFLAPQFGISQLRNGCVLRMLSPWAKKMRLTVSAESFSLSTADPLSFVSMTVSVATLARTSDPSAGAQKYKYVNIDQAVLRREWSSSTGVWSGTHEAEVTIYPRYALAVLFRGEAWNLQGPIFSPNSGRIRLYFTEV